MAKMARNILRIATLVATCGLLLVAGESSGSAATSKSPVKIMLIAPISSSIASLVEIPAAVEAAAKQVNHEGGLQGHPIQVVTCNEPGDPNIATRCAQQAVADKVIAAVSTYSEFSDNVYAAFKKAGIVNLGDNALNPGDFGSPQSFPLTPGLIVQYVA